MSAGDLIEVPLGTPLLSILNSKVPVLEETPKDGPAQMAPVQGMMPREMTKEGPTLEVPVREVLRVE
jgi:hypothetical protein